MEMKRVNVYIEPDIWERFKKIAKYKDSDASKEIRKMVKRYLAENSQLFLEMEAKDKK
jgi:metal-responsive CopG/Arc/MetJ family transcriptional regulator